MPLAPTSAPMPHRITVAGSSSAINASDSPNASTKTMGTAQASCARMNSMTGTAKSGSVKREYSIVARGKAGRPVRQAAPPPNLLLRQPTFKGVREDSSCGLFVQMNGITSRCRVVRRCGCNLARAGIVHAEVLQRMGNADVGAQFENVIQEVG